LLNSFGRNEHQEALPLENKKGWKGMSVTRANVFFFTHLSQAPKGVK
jgi:hypothetical protein